MNDPIEPVPGMESDKAGPPTADIWAADGVINLVIGNAEIIEYEGNLAPGLGLSPLAAITLAHVLTSKALEALTDDDDKDE